MDGSTWLVVAAASATDAGVNIWEMLATIAQLASAVVALAALGVVTYQSMQTKKSAESSAEAAQAAAEGLSIATSALVVARDEEKHSRELVAEAHRTRRDAALPEISVAPSSKTFGFYLKRAGSRRWEECPADQVWHLPSDDHDRLGIAFRVTISNGSRRQVALRLHGYTVPGQEPHWQETILPLKAESAIDVDFMAWTSIKMWALQWKGEVKTIETGNFHSPFGLYYLDQQDDGADIYWNVHLSGSPIFEQKPATVGRYCFWMAWDESDLNMNQPEAPTIDVRESRAYWVSRERDVPVGAARSDLDE